jgi:hypothetical protein
MCTALHSLLGPIIVGGISWWVWSLMEPAAVPLLQADHLAGLHQCFGSGIWEVLGAKMHTSLWLSELNSNHQVHSCHRTDSRMLGAAVLCYIAAVSCIQAVLCPAVLCAVCCVVPPFRVCCHGVR